MDDDALEDALLGLARRIGVRVRPCPFDKALFGELAGRATGGLCRLHGELVILLDDTLDRPERLAVLTEALSRFDVEPFAMPPAARDRLEAARRRREARPQPRRLRRV